MESNLHTQLWLLQGLHTVPIMVDVARKVLC